MKKSKLFRYIGCAFLACTVILGLSACGLSKKKVIGSWEVNKVIKSNIGEETKEISIDDYIESGASVKVVSIGKGSFVLARKMGFQEDGIAIIEDVNGNIIEQDWKIDDKTIISKAYNWWKEDEYLKYAYAGANGSYQFFYSKVE